MLFRVVADCFDALERESGRTRMVERAVVLFRQLTAAEARAVAYLILGQVRAPYQGPTVFNMAERSLAEVVAQVVGQEVWCIEESFKMLGEMGNVVAALQWQSEGSVTITAVFDALCVWEQLTGSGSQEIRRCMLADLLRSMTPIEARWVIRIILGKLRLGFSEMTLIEVIACLLFGTKAGKKQVERAYNICVDIGRIMECAVSEGPAGIDRISPLVGIPIRPAAAERLPTAAAVFEKLGPCVAQPKLDGFRVQIHIMTDQVTGQRTVCSFSRNLLPMHGMFPELDAALVLLPVHEAILEGEAIAIDEETQTLLPFQETVKRRRKHAIIEMTQSHPLRMVLFDLLLCDGELLYEQPQHVRYERLCRLTGQSRAEVVSVIAEQRIDSARALEEYFVALVAEGYEGVIVKRPDAAYQAGTRNFTWIKLKRHNIGQLEDTVDAVVLGYYHGQGKRAGLGIGVLLMGIFDAQREVLVTIAKLGTGFSDEEWRQLKEQCDRVRVKNKPARLECADSLVPDVWLNPAIIIEVAADQITKSPVHSAGWSEVEGYGFALRFPRAIGVRTDKLVSEATTLDEIRRMYANQGAVQR